MATTAGGVEVDAPPSTGGSVIDQLHARISVLEAVAEVVAAAPRSLVLPAILPLGPRGFIHGTIVHTNEVACPLDTTHRLPAGAEAVVGRDAPSYVWKPACVAEAMIRARAEGLRDAVARAHQAHARASSEDDVADGVAARYHARAHTSLHRSLANLEANTHTVAGGGSVTFAPDVTAGHGDSSHGAGGKAPLVAYITEEEVGEEGTAGAMAPRPRTTPAPGRVGAAPSTAAHDRLLVQLARLEAAAGASGVGTPVEVWEEDGMAAGPPAPAVATQHGAGAKGGKRSVRFDASVPQGHDVPSAAPSPLPTPPPSSAPSLAPAFSGVIMERLPARAGGVVTVASAPTLRPWPGTMVQHGHGDEAGGVGTTTTTAAALGASAPEPVRLSRFKAARAGHG